uniref:Transposase n=1 Tax=Haemonchus placei TaxID=6290 RepID=A0A0N4WR38_HAEPC
LTPEIRRKFRNILHHLVSSTRSGSVLICDQLKIGSFPGDVISEYVVNLEQSCNISFI